MVNRETRRKIDLDARRGERKKENIEVHFLGKDWLFPAMPSLAAVVAIEHEKFGDALIALLGAEKAGELIADPDCDIEDLGYLFEHVYDESLGEASASSDS